MNPLTSRRGELHAAIEESGYAPYLVGWVLRRESEGGRPLVEAWARIAADLAGRLADANEP